MAWNPNVPTVTNRVQDDLDAIRENFQHLDQLAERVDELQTVSGLAPIANDLQAVSGLAQAVDELQAVSGLASVVEELQTVSGLAPVANELQTVSGLAQITDDLQAVSELAPYVQALLDSRIVEMGSNSNGEYVRWENGLQVCYHRLIIGTPSGAQSFSWTYPAAFASSDDAYPMGIVAVSSTDAGVFGRYVKSAVRRSLETLATQTTFFVEFSSAPSTTIHIHAFAIGRWK